MQEWKVIKLKDCIEEITEKTTKNNQYKILTSSQNGIYLQEEYFNKQVASKDNIGYKIIKKGEFTYRSMSDTGRFTINRLENIDIGIISPAYPVFKAKHIEPEYLKYFFQSELFRKSINNLSQGSTRVALKIDELKEIKLAIPIQKEQRKILSILSNVDSIIEKVNEDIKNIQKEKQIIMKNIFNYGIYHEKLRSTNIGQIPESWEVKKFQDLIDSKDILDIMDGNHGELHPTTKDYVPNGIPFIMANNIVDGKLNLENCKFISKERAEMLRKGFSKENDVLITHKGSVGNVAIVKNITTPYIMLTPQVTYYRINEQSKILIKEYLYYFFQSPNFQNRLKILSAQSTRAYIGITAQKQLDIVIPKIEEQNKIVEILSKLDNKLILLKKKNKEYQKLKKGLMQQLLTGKVRVKI